MGVRGGDQEWAWGRGPGVCVKGGDQECAWGEGTRSGCEGRGPGVCVKGGDQEWE